MHPFDLLVQEVIETTDLPFVDKKVRVINLKEEREGGREEGREREREGGRKGGRKGRRKGSRDIPTRLTLAESCISRL